MAHPTAFLLCPAVGVRTTSSLAAYTANPVRPSNPAYARPVSRATHVIAMVFGKGKDGDRSKNESSFGRDDNPYRLLGVPIDCTYEQVEKVLVKLKEQYKDNLEKISFFEEQKDKIFADKLKRRMSGSISPKIKESPYEKKPKPKRKFVMPEWAKKIYKKPEMAQAQKSGILMLLYLVGSVLAPTMTSSSLAMGFVTSAAFLYNRGLPEPVKDEYGNAGEIQPVKNWVLLRTLAIIGLVSLLSFGTAQAIIMFVPLPMWVMPDTFVNTILLTAQWVASICFYTQDI
mmetsp:Transcript_997/g.1624  ORF Transcript_997/g.1624 Transcript_997/m.1624 type:complete len:286 (+) Transcript_997:123-980(+)